MQRGAPTAVSSLTGTHWGGRDFGLCIYDMNTGTSTGTGVVSGDFQQGIDWAENGNIYFTWMDSASKNYLGVYNTNTEVSAKLTDGKINGYMDVCWVGESNVGCWYADAATGIHFASIWNGAVWHDDLWIGKWGQDILRHPTFNAAGRLLFSAGNYIYESNLSWLDRIDKGTHPVVGPSGGYASSGAGGSRRVDNHSVPARS